MNEFQFNFINQYYQLLYIIIQKTFIEYDQELKLGKNIYHASATLNINLSKNFIELEQLKNILTDKQIDILLKLFKSYENHDLKDESEKKMKDFINYMIVLNVSSTKNFFVKLLKFISINIEKIIAGVIAYKFRSSIYNGIAPGLQQIPGIGKYLPFSLTQIATTEEISRRVAEQVA
jgi:hypothetical protein